MFAIVVYVFLMLSAAAVALYATFELAVIDAAQMVEGVAMGFVAV